MNQQTGIYHLTDCEYAVKCKHCIRVASWEAVDIARLCYWCLARIIEP